MMQPPLENTSRPTTPVTVFAAYIQNPRHALLLTQNFSLPEIYLCPSLHPLEEVTDSLRDLTGLTLKLAHIFNPTAAHIDRNRAITYGLFNPIEGRLKSRAGLSWTGPAKALELLATTPNGAPPYALNVVQDCLPKGQQPRWRAKNATHR